jgi:hypothetical protein
MNNNNNNKFYNNLNKNNLYNDITNIDLNNLNHTDIQHLKISLNNLKKLSNILKEKNNIIDGMLLSTKKRKKIITQEKTEKENEIIKLDNEINIYYNKLFSEYLNENNNKSIILSKIKFLRRELTQNKYIDYLNKKIMVEQKEEKMQKKLALLSTEQLELFNKEIYNNQIFNNDKEKQNIELIKKQYEDIKKKEIFSKIFNEIKESLYKDKYNNESVNSSLIKSKKKFNSKMLNINQSKKGSCASLHTVSQGNYEMRSEMFSNKAKKNKGNHSVEIKNLMSNDSSMLNNEINATQKYLLSNNNYRKNSQDSKRLLNKKNSKFNSKLFMSNHYL